MGSKKQFLVQSLKRAAALASVLGVLGGISAGAVSAQTARYQPLNQQSQRAALGTPLRSGVAPPIPTSYSRIPSQNSVRIVGAQPATPPRSTQQATVNRRALIGRGRMISAGYPQDSAVAPGPGGLPQDPDQSVLQRDDKQTPDIFGNDQPIPTVPKNDFPLNPTPQDPETAEPQNGELPDDIFKDPFKDERRPNQTKPPVEIPGQMEPTPADPPKNGDDLPKDPDTQTDPNPFKPEETIPDDQIDYKPGRGFSPTQSQSNVYAPPGSRDVLEQKRQRRLFCSCL